MDPLLIILTIIIIILSVVVHEVAHGYAALWLGDTTAQYAGRLTLNPIKHLDFFGSFLVPLLLSFSGVVLGWAKPVPYNPYNLKNRRWGELLVAIAGPISNILLAIIFALFVRVAGGDADYITDTVLIAAMVVNINIALAVFNMIPIPPLDGSKVLFALIPKQYEKIKIALERSGFIIILIIIFFFSQFLAPINNFLFGLATGIYF